MFDKHFYIVYCVLHCLVVQLLAGYKTLRFLSDNNKPLYPTSTLYILYYCHYTTPTDQTQYIGASISPLHRPLFPTKHLRTSKKVAQEMVKGVIYMHFNLTPFNGYGK